MAFNLGDMLRQVSEPDTGMDQIEYIPLDLIDEDPNNFYQLTDIAALADNISLCGLQQPIRVRQLENGRYMIVSGHRRRAALAMLVADGYDVFSKAACIVERDEVSPALQQLRLIYANASTRKLTDAEISEQAAQVEKLLYQLKEEGYDFPGRMRDHVAEAVGKSKSKLARLKVIREKMAVCWTFAWASGKLAESTAYTLAQNPVEWQQIIFNLHGEAPNQVYEGTVSEIMKRFAKIDKTQCSHGFCTGCDNRTNMMVKSAKDRWSDPCHTGCCYDCVNLTRCRSVCPHCDDHAAEKKLAEKISTENSRKAQEEKDAPILDLIRSVYSRVGQLRKERNVSVESLMKAQRRMYDVSYEKAQKSLESGTAKISTNTALPFGYSFRASDAEALIRVADTLGCSIDYLMGRTENPDMSHVPDSGPGWRTGEPDAKGKYVLLLTRNPYADPRAEVWLWDGLHFDGGGFAYEESLDGKILGWAPMLDLSEVQYD